ncbi:MAG: methyltransferase domain-containing protein [Desulfobaccales bacterium]|nr:methyltransferase domain-containing protein [Desulfobaccales bacterium]
MEIKQGIRRNFARRAASYDRHAGTQRLMAQRLMALTEDFVPRVARILEIGCGTGCLTWQLRQANTAAQVVALDLDVALVAAARRRLGPDSGVAWLVADGETWARGCFDLIMANAVFQWLTRPAATLAVYFKSLAPGGVLAFSTLGPQTFKELGASLRQAANGLNFKVIPEIPAQGFLDKQSWAGLLSQAGFHKTRLTQELITVTFPTVRDFLKSLQATGATNPQPRAFAPRLFKALMAAYESGFGYNGFIPVTYEIICAIARK